MSFGLLSILIQQGLDVKVTDKLGRTALHVIAESKLPQSTSKEIIRLPIAQGCDPGHLSHSDATASHTLLSNESFMNESNVIERLITSNCFPRNQRRLQWIVVV